MAAAYTATDQTNEQRARGLYQPATLLITTESLGPINGVTNATNRLLGYLDRFGIAPVVLAPETNRPVALPEHTHVVRLPGHPVPYNPELRVITPRVAKNALRKLPRPHVLYVASPASLGVSAWWQLRAHNVPTVINYQTDLSAYARQVMPTLPGHLLAAGVDKLTAYMFGHPTVKTIFCPSRYSQQQLESIGVPSHKIQRVGRGVDCVLFNPTRRSAELRQRLAPNGEVLLLCVSRVSLEKNFAFLARAFRALTEAHRADSPRFRLIVTGGNANPTIEAQIHRLFDGLDMVFTGVLTGTALAEMYASADAFVFPSLTETFGQVVQEAMASALPVLAMAQGGPADLVLPDETGYLCAPDDAHALTDWLRYATMLIESPERRATFGANGLHIARERDWESVNARIWEAIVAAA